MIFNENYNHCCQTLWKHLKKYICAIIFYNYDLKTNCIRIPLNIVVRLCILYVKQENMKIFMCINDKQNMYK